MKLLSAVPLLCIAALATLCCALRSSRLRPRTSSKLASVTDRAESLKDLGENDTSDLDRIARMMKMKVFDVDEQIFGIDSCNVAYGIEVVNVKLTNTRPIGLQLVEEIATRHSGVQDERGLVLVEGTSPDSPASRAIRSGTSEKTESLEDELIHRGDTIVAVSWQEKNRDLNDRRIVERVEGLNLGSTLEAINKACSSSSDGYIGLSLKRLVRRQMVEVDVITKKKDGSIEQKNLSVLSGSNLRMELIRKSLELYDPRSRRYDQPYSTGDCGGEGICGTCTIDIQEGANMLSPPDPVEAMMMKSRGNSWRLACRCFVGPENKPGKLKIKLRPQID